jgi:hypothetical protein
MPSDRARRRRRCSEAGTLRRAREAHQTRPSYAGCSCSSRQARRRLGMRNTHLPAWDGWRGVTAGEDLGFLAPAVRDATARSVTNVIHLAAAGLRAAVGGAQRWPAPRARCEVARLRRARSATRKLGARRRGPDARAAEGAPAADVVMLRRRRAKHARGGSGRQGRVLSRAPWFLGALLRLYALG